MFLSHCLIVSHVFITQCLKKQGFNLAVSFIEDLAQIEDIEEEKL